MARELHSFKIQSKKKVLDYRLGRKLNLAKIRIFFQKKYSVKKLWQGHRHVLGILNKNNTDYFLKLSTSEGISLVTKNEYDWNGYFNKYFPGDYQFYVPRNYENGFYEKIYFYLITDYFEGRLLCNIHGEANTLIKYISDVILLSELIQKLPAKNFSNTRPEINNYREKFITKVNNWFGDIPVDICRKFKVKQLLEIVFNGVNQLGSKPRHGDFTPWHLINLKDTGLGLIDGEHATADSVENYDICYFIQRVFSVLNDPPTAKKIYLKLIGKGYNKDKIKTVLAARAIGGFLDESLKEKPDYKFANDFKDWIIKT